MFVLSPHYDYIAKVESVFSSIAPPVMILFASVFVLTVFLSYLLVSCVPFYWEMS